MRSRKEHESHMLIALGEAKKSKELGLLPVGAVLVIDDKVVGKSHKREDAHSYYLDHAEILLLREYFRGKHIKRGAHDVALYTTLEPCLMCFGTALHLPINEIVYAARDLYGGGSYFADSEGKSIRHADNKLNVVGKIMEKESKALLRSFMEEGTNKFFNKENTDNPLVEYIFEK